MSQPRKMTIMFADVSGSARLFERLQDTEAAHAVERCMRERRGCLNRFTKRGATART